MRVRMTIDGLITYDELVDQTFADLRVLPTERGNYTLLALKVDVEPGCWQDNYTDMYGTHVMSLHVTDPHSAVHLHAQAELEPDHEVVALREGHDEAGNTAQAVAADTDWDTIFDPDRQDRWCDFLTEVEGLKINAARVKKARSLPTPLEAVTHVASALASPSRVTRLDKVDQHTRELMGEIRALGIPTRFVSGYITKKDLPFDEPVNLRLSSWIEVWCGTWYGIDPMTGERISPQAITIGYGRDRNDLAPIRALHTGSTGSSSKVSATIRRIA